MRLAAALLSAALLAGPPLARSEGGRHAKSKKANAGWKHGKKEGGGPEYRKPVLVEAIGFRARYDHEHAKVVTGWRRYKRADFKYYKVMKSASDPDPVYPDEPAAWATDEAGETSWTDWEASPGTWHYRVVIVTEGGSRWVSPVVTLEIGGRSAPSPPPGASDFE